MSHGLAPNDERRQLYKEAREALSRVEFPNKDWYWLRSMKQLGGGRAFTKPAGAASTVASLALDAQERMLMIEALRKILGPASSEVPFRAEVSGPLSLTLDEWLSIRGELLRYFFEIGGERKEHKLERLIARIEHLIAFEQAADRRSEGQAACPQVDCDTRQRPTPPAPTARARKIRRRRQVRPFRLPGPRIGTQRELGLAMLLDDEGPLPAWMLHADGTLLASLASRGVIAVQPGSGEGNEVWVLTAEGRSEARRCQQLYTDWLERTYAKGPFVGPKRKQSPSR